MPFLSLSNADVKFGEKELTWRSYSAAEALPTTKRVQIIDQKECAAAALDPDEEAFVVHICSFSGIDDVDPSGSGSPDLLISSLYTWMTSSFTLRTWARATSKPYGWSSSSRESTPYANPKKYRFHQEEVRFLGYVVSSRGICMKDERIKAVKNWPEPRVSTRHSGIHRLCKFLS